METLVEDGLHGGMDGRSLVVVAVGDTGEAIAINLRPQVASVKVVALVVPEVCLNWVLNLLS